LMRRELGMAKDATEPRWPAEVSDRRSATLPLPPPFAIMPRCPLLPLLGMGGGGGRLPRGGEPGGGTMGRAWRGGPLPELEGAFDWRRLALAVVAVAVPGVLAVEELFEPGDIMLSRAKDDGRGRGTVGMSWMVVRASLAT
jgi:hypothetical protein